MADSPRYLLCPYCGHPQPPAPRCSQCSGHFEPLSRKATQISMGPWFIRDHAMPFRPGCSFEVIRKQVESGRIKANTVLRGPTTHQYWLLARSTPGVAHLLGYCHECNQHVKPTDRACSRCKAEFAVPAQRNELGLLYPTEDAVEHARRKLQMQIERAMKAGTAVVSEKPAVSQGQSSALAHAPSVEAMPVESVKVVKAVEEDEANSPAEGGVDLLDQVLHVAGVASPAPGSDRAVDQAGEAAASSHLKDESGFLWSVHQAGDASQADGAEPMGAAWPASGSRRPKPWLMWFLIASNVVVVGLLGLAVWVLSQKG